jgi:hypothetical protein
MHGRAKLKLLCLFLFISHLAGAGELTNKKECHSERIFFLAKYCIELKKDSSGMTSLLRSINDTRRNDASPPKNLLNSPPISLALQTNTLQLPSKGGMWLHAGFELRSNWQAPITRAIGDLYRYGTLRFDLGLAENVSFQVRGAVRQILSSNSKTVARDAGDFSIATITRVLAEKPYRPALGFRVETKLPNTNQDRGIGNNTTDITMSILATKQFGSALVFSDLGLAIMSAPRQINDQNDALVYGFGALWNAGKKLQLAGEINGFTSPRNQIPLGTEDRSTARLGVAWKFSRVALEILAVKGLLKREGNWGIIAGLSAQLRGREDE